LRRLIALLVGVAIIVAGLAVADIWIRHKVQSEVASHIDSELPGSHATVSISSFPFVGRLITSGTVPKLTVDVDNVQVDGITFGAIDIVVHQLKVDTSQLTSAKVVLRSISSGSVTADIPQTSIDQKLGQSLTLGSGTVSLDGVSVQPSISVSNTAVTLGMAGLPSITVPIPQLSLLPCVSAAVIVPGAVQLSCALSALPPALADYSAALT
jgi:hypothetical protein